MDLYLAGTFDLHRDVPDDLQVPNILKSYYYLREKDSDTIAHLLSHSDKFMLDSGAFTFLTNPDIDEDLDEFVDGYIQFINEWDIDHYVEMDVDSREGEAQVREYRDRMERETGKQSIPIWHPSRGKDAFITLCEEYDYIGFGGIYDEIKPSWFKYFPWFIRQAHARGTKIHGMGFTPTKDLSQYPFDSVDSRSWLFGAIGRSSPEYKFTGTELITVRHSDKKRAGHHMEIQHTNCRAWVQYANYLRGKYGLEQYDGPRLDQGDDPPPEHIDSRPTYDLPPQSEW